MVCQEILWFKSLRFQRDKVRTSICIENSYLKGPAGELLESGLNGEDSAGVGEIREAGNQNAGVGEDGGLFGGVEAVGADEITGEGA